MTSPAIGPATGEKVSAEEGRKLLRFLEAPIGIEPMNGGFADLCLTTWLRRRRGSILPRVRHFLNPPNHYEGRRKVIVGSFVGTFFQLHARFSPARADAARASRSLSSTPVRLAATFAASSAK